MRLAPLVLLLLVVAGCARQAAPTAPVQVPVAATPAGASLPLCQVISQWSEPAVVLRGGDWAHGGLLAAESCLRGVKAGTAVQVEVTVPPDKAGKGVRVTGTSATGRWNVNLFSLVLTLAEGEQVEVTLDAAELGLPAARTYRFVGRRQTTVALSSAQDQKGPWTPYAEPNLVIPTAHRWLRAEFSRPMPPETLQKVTLDGGKTAPTPDGDRAVLFDLSRYSPVFEFRMPVEDEFGMWFSRVGARYGFHGDPPALQRVSPGGPATTVATLPRVPDEFDFADEAGVVLYRFYEKDRPSPYSGLDAETGKTVEGALPGLNRRVAPLSVSTPDGKRWAQVVLPEKQPLPAQRIDPADLIIQEGGKEVLRVKQWLQVTRQEIICLRGVYGVAWRPDGGAVAAISVGAPGRLELKTYDLATGQSRVLADLPGQPDLAFDWIVSWAPGGKHLTFGPLLLEADSGRTVAREIPDRQYWSADGRYLLLNRRHHFFTNWGALSLLDTATGKVQELGQGQAFGWTPKGEAIVVRWDMSREIPPPAKGCP